MFLSLLKQKQLLKRTYFNNCLTDNRHGAKHLLKESFNFSFKHGLS